MSDVEYDAEQEVNLRSLWERLALRWWLPVGGLALGLVIGILLALGGGQVYEAKTIVFLGQPFTPTGGGQIQSLATNPRTAAENVRSEAALRYAARVSGLRVSQLRGAVSTQSITTAGQRATTTPLFEIAVKGPAPGKVEKAANALAGRLISNVSIYVDQKIATLERRIAADQTELEGINERLAQAQQQQREILANRSLGLTERLLLLTNYNSTLGFGEQRRGVVQQDLFEAQQLLSLAQNVERSRVFEPGVATKTTARSTRNSALVGALLGLLLGAVAALAAEPVLARRATAS